MGVFRIKFCIWCFIWFGSPSKTLKGDQDLSEPEGFRKHVSDLLCVTPGLIRSSVTLNDDATFVSLPRTKDQKRSGSVIGMFTESAINELESMEGEFAG